MKKMAGVKAVLVLAALVLLSTSAYAEITNTTGLYFRLRQETWDNIITQQELNPATGKPNNDDDYWRLKTSVWFKSELDKQGVFYVKLTNEARYFMDTSNTAARPAGLNKDEILFDNLYINANNIADLPVDVTIGRQDLMNYGDGFVMIDGTPGDGSRTFYFDAAKAVLKFGEKSTLDLIWITDQFNDRALPSWYDHSVGKRALNNTDEQAAVAYGRIKIDDNLGVEPYYIYKREEATTKPFPTRNSALELNTVGARAVFGPGDGWKVKGEYGHQFGKYNDGNNRSGDAGYFFLGRAYENIALKPSFDLGYLYLSGDKPGTPRVEAWDPLFSRYPAPWFYSELYYLSLGKETGINGYWANLRIYRASVKLAVAAETALNLSYNYLGAIYNTYGGTSIFSTSGKKRGDLITAQLTHKFSTAVSGYVIVEDLVPGNYYLPENRDNVMFVRWQLEFKI